MTAFSPGQSPPPVNTATRTPTTVRAMAWDSTRRVPWKKVLTPFALYAVVAFVLFSVLGKGFDAGLIVGIAAGGVVYALLAAVMVKFGWSPPMFQSKEERAATAAANAERRAARAAAKSARPRRRRPAGPTSAPTPPTRAKTPALMECHRGDRLCRAPPGQPRAAKRRRR